MTDDLLVLAELIAEQAAHMDAAEHRLLTNIREFDKRHGWRSAQSCAHWLSWRVGWTPNTAREHVRVARALGELPHIDEALRNGKVSYSKVRAMTRVATPSNERVLLMDAELTTGAQLERVCRKYRQLRRLADGATPERDDAARYVRRSDLDNGMTRIEVVLPAEEAALVWAMIDRATKDLHGQGLSEERLAPSGTRPVEDMATTDVGVSAETCGSLCVAEEALESRSDRACVSAETSAGILHDAVSDDDAANEHDEPTEYETYEADCAFFERFGVTLDRRDYEPSARVAYDEAYEETSGDVSRADVSIVPERVGGASCVKRRTLRFNRADGLVSLARRFVTGDVPRSPFEIVVTVTADAVQGGAREEDAIAMLDDGGCVAAETARRLACDAGVVHMTEDEHGNPLNVGRRSRVISSAMRRALFKRDRTCRFPGCTNTLFTEGHHIEHWANGGETKLTNLLRLCDRHHAFVHEYGYRIVMGTDGEPQFFDERGRRVENCPPRIIRDDLGWSHVFSANRDLGIQPHRCGWDGERIEYADVCRALYRLDDGSIVADDILAASRSQHRCLDGRLDDSQRSS